MRYSMRGASIMASEEPFDTGEPSEERKAELKGAYEENIRMGRAPYEGISIRSSGEVKWIFQQHRWSGEMELSEGEKRPDLRHVSLVGVDLSGIPLRWANLDHADLRKVSYQGTIQRTSLRGALLRFADLREADLSGANLSSVSLRGADLRGADLTRALMNAETVLTDVRLDAQTKISGVIWNSVPLDLVDWSMAPAIGDEPDPRHLVRQSRKKRAEAYHNAARAYHGLVVALRDQGLSQYASLYRLRELAMQRRALRTERNIGGWLLNAALGMLAGNGEKPGRAFGAYLSIVALFAAIYWGVTNFLDTATPHLRWYEAIVLSLTSFHGRGFFPDTIPLSDPLAIVAAIEAVCGLFIELIFIATFSRRFLGD
jgi:uncharacterized protein YjbI with pentapeptide repeats